MEDNATDELDIVMSLAQDPLRSLPTDSKGLGQEII
jgi:hypothetical protein